MSAPAELSRPVRVDTIGAVPRDIVVAADAAERAALVGRFGLLALDRFEATLSLLRTGDAVAATGWLDAQAMQACIATGEPVPATIHEPITLRFVPASAPGAGEIELDEGDLDVLPYDGGTIDLGEATAQTLSLALDPFPRAPDADAALRTAGVLTEEDAAAARRETSPFAALKALKAD